MTTTEILTLLNEAVKADRHAMALLVKSRTGCNQALADHPTIEVGLCNRCGRNHPEVGLLGILNGITRLDGDTIAAVFDDDTGFLVEFRSI